MTLGNYKNYKKDFITREIMKKFIFWGIVLIAHYSIADADYSEEATYFEESKANVSEQKIQSEPIKNVQPVENIQPADGLVTVDMNPKQQQKLNNELNMVLTSDSMFQRAPGYVKTLPTYKIIGMGLTRSFANLTLGAGELARGITYEVSAKPWYLSMITWIPVGVGGILSRVCVGVADLVTFGYFGDIMIAPGYPDYVWQGDWLYHPKHVERIKSESETDSRSKNNPTANQLSPEIRSNKVINTTAPLQ